MEYLAISICILALAICIGILSGSLLISRLYFYAENLQIDFTGSELSWESDDETSKRDEVQTGKQLVAESSNVLDFDRRKTAAAVGEKQAENRKKKDEKAFWDDLAALEAEQERLQTGGSDAAVFDSLDHARAVAERIEELKEQTAPAPAA